MDKGGCVLVNKEGTKIGLVYRQKRDDYSFPKGHLEKNETICECALRETEEETGRRCRLLLLEPLGIISYNNSEGKIKNYMFLARDEGESNKEFTEDEKETFFWVDFDEVEDKLTYQNLKDFWNEVEDKIREVIKK